LYKPTSSIVKTVALKHNTIFHNKNIQHLPELITKNNPNLGIIIVFVLQ